MADLCLQGATRQRAGPEEDEAQGRAEDKEAAPGSSKIKIRLAKYIKSAKDSNLLPMDWAPKAGVEVKDPIQQVVAACLQERRKSTHANGSSTKSGHQESASGGNASGCQKVLVIDAAQRLHAQSIIEDMLPKLSVNSKLVICYQKSSGSGSSARSMSLVECLAAHGYEKGTINLEFVPRRYGQAQILADMTPAPSAVLLVDLCEAALG